MNKKRIPLSEKRKAVLKGVEAVFQQAEEEKKTKSVKPKIRKVTYDIEESLVLKLETIQLKQRYRTGDKPTKNQLIAEAIELLVEKYEEVLMEKL